LPPRRDGDGKPKGTTPKSKTRTPKKPTYESRDRDADKIRRQSRTGGDEENGNKILRRRADLLEETEIEVGNEHSTLNIQHRTSNNH
jgi:hypothetical protein